MMNLDIQTEHVAMTPEWHRMIDEWVALCRRRHPLVGALDLTLRHGNERVASEQVDAVATAGPRNVRAHARAEVMGVALGDALESLERELCVSDVVEQRGRGRPIRGSTTS
jgi:ribosome-associated translation inhibitor RaiA